MQRSLLRWILICAVGLNLFYYAGAVLLNFHSWIVLDPDFIDQPAMQYIFLDRRETLGELLKHKLFHAAVLSLLGIAAWLIQRFYSSKRNAG